MTKPTDRLPLACQRDGCSTLCVGDTHVAEPPMVQAAPSGYWSLAPALPAHPIRRADLARVRTTTTTR